MNVFERMIRRLDGWQQRHRPAAFTVGVVKKYGDDNGGQLAASMSHAAFVSLFPLLLVLVTILGLVAASDPTLRDQVVSAVTKQFPLIGQDLSRNVRQLHKSSLIGLIAGLLITLWGTSGLAQTGMYTMAQIWNIPGPKRPGYLPRLARTGLFLVVLAIGVLATTGLASLTAFGSHLVVIVVGADALALMVNMGMYVLAFRVLTPRGVPTWDLVPGAMLAGVAWTILQAGGALVVGHFLDSGSVYGIFAIVLSLLAWIYLVVNVTVYAAEVNVVRVRRLWPRSLVQPPLTEADRAALALQPLQNQRREEQQIVVSFTDRAHPVPAPPGTPQTPADVAPPARDGPRPEPDLRAGKRQKRTPL
ncbi:MAG TPA: YihY/virulence factor BrkB family protein [Streptosporangiaceae bacterium]|nr:YihY/virulence factor BrkB family protein [Streptosporangiaceae bacterium]